MKRFVSYLYSIYNNQKIHNAGFARIELRTGRNRVDIHLRENGYSGKTGTVYLFIRKQENIQGISIGNITFRNNQADFRYEQPEENIGQTPWPIMEMHGILIMIDDRAAFLSQWDEQPIDTERFEVWNIDKLHPMQNTQEGSGNQHPTQNTQVEPDNQRNHTQVVTGGQHLSGDGQAVTGGQYLSGNGQAVTDDQHLSGNGQVATGDQHLSGNGQAVTGGQYLSGDEQVVTGGQHLSGDTQAVSGSQKLLDDMQAASGSQQLSDDTQAVSGSQQLSQNAARTGAGQIVENRGSDAGKIQSVRERGRNIGKIQEGRKEESNFENIQTVKDKGTDFEVAEAESKQFGIQPDENNLQPEQNVKAKPWNGQMAQDTETRAGNLQTEPGKQISSADYSQQAQSMRAEPGKQLSGTDHAQQTQDIQPSPGQPSSIQTAELKPQPISQWEQNWRYMLRTYPVMNQFKDENKILCVRIELKDVRLLPEKYWSMINNSFLLHGFFNYRYLVFGRIEQNWFVGIPGIYQNQEHVMASIFGFPDFLPQAQKNEGGGQPGYWYRILDI